MILRRLSNCNFLFKYKYMIIFIFEPNFYSPLKSCSIFRIIGITHYLSSYDKTVSSLYKTIVLFTK